MNNKQKINLNNEQLYCEICNIIDNAKKHIATYINTEICLTNWHIGSRINIFILKHQRAEYGKQIIKNTAIKLTYKYGPGWGEKKLRHCLRVAETFSKEEIITLTQNQLTWTHIKTLTYIQNKLERRFYTQLCSTEHWDTRTLDEMIDKQLFQRTAISHKPEEIIKEELNTAQNNNQLHPDMVFKSSYFLDMLGLPDIYSEKELENAIITQVEEFIRELGSDFTFIARQKRITIDTTDYYIDLLFYNRELRRLVAIELKLGKFKPEHEGQMLLYLRYLNRNERKKWEEAPIGLILCSEGNTEHIEYLMLDDESPIKVAQYYTKLPTKEILSEKLHKAILIAKRTHREMEENKEDDGSIFNN